MLVALDTVRRLLAEISLLRTEAADFKRSKVYYLRAIANSRHGPSNCVRRCRSPDFALLAPIYASFTEGFKTRDLIDAKAVAFVLREPGRPNDAYMVTPDKERRYVGGEWTDERCQQGVVVGGRPMNQALGWT